MSGSVLIAGTQSGVGKTTLTMGLIAALRQRGLRVQPFKCGPDYIDPTYHTLAAGLPCRNLDTWMVPPDRAVEMYRRAAASSDIAVIEGVMGLFDGFSYADEEGSTAQIAKLTGAPVLLVLDVGKMARSAGALALGYTRFDPALNIAGFILNRCGSTHHFEGVKLAVEQASGRPVVGWLPKDANLHIPERHLGLVPTDERGELTAFVEHAAAVIGQYFDLDKIIEISRSQHPQMRLHSASEDALLREIEDAPPLNLPHWEGGWEGSKTSQSKIVNPKSKIQIAVARDAAFSFYYEDNLDLLREAGAEICFFSPLADSALPPNISGLYLGGGFPEMYAAQLSANTPLLEAVRQAHAAGLPIFAECGGLMLLTAAITDLEGQSHPMAGLVPGAVQMQPKLVSLGYRLVESPTGNWLLPQGATTRGHEFHWSTWSRQEAGQHTDTAAWAIQPRRAGGVPKLDGYAQGNLIASYVHLHFAHDLRLARNFVAVCEQQLRIKN